MAVTRSYPKARWLKPSLRNQPKAPKDESFGVEAFLADAPGGRR